jgi:peptidyl-prolyl cis-trans isomerase B (cyclophilin B)
MHAALLRWMGGNRWIPAALTLSMGLAFAAQSAETPAAADTPAASSAGPEIAVIQFKDIGELRVEFWPEVAPMTVENFKKLAKDGFYNGTASHRLIPGFMIQLGDPLTKDAAMEHRWGTGDPGYKIKAEFNERRHVRGVLSMARSANPDSAGSQFFICFAPAPSLDRKYTAFGKVVGGEDVLAKLEKIPVTDSGRGERSKPVQRVHVESIRIVSPETPATSAPPAP